MIKEPKISPKMLKGKTSWQLSMYFLSAPNSLFNPCSVITTEFCKTFVFHSGHDVAFSGRVWRYVAKRVSLPLLVSNTNVKTCLYFPVVTYLQVRGPGQWASAWLNDHLPCASTISWRGVFCVCDSAPLLTLVTIQWPAINHLHLSLNSNQGEGTPLSSFFFPGFFPSAPGLAFSKDVH